jgi:hypothetical protein
MSEPIEFQILQNAQAALQGIAVASGDYYDLDADAVKLDPDVDIEQLLGKDGIRPFIYLQPLPEQWFYESSRPNVVRIEWPIKIHWVNDTDGDARRGTGQDRSARVRGRGAGHARDISRGGLAGDHRVTTRTFNVSQDGLQVWAEIDTLVRVRRVYGQP